MTIEIRLLGRFSALRDTEEIPPGAFGGKLALAGLSERVRTVFDVVRLNEILAIYPTVAEAIAISVVEP